MEMVNINIVDLVVDDERLTVNSSVHLEGYDIRGVPTHSLEDQCKTKRTRTQYHRILRLNVERCTQNHRFFCQHKK